METLLLTLLILECTAYLPGLILALLTSLLLLQPQLVLLYLLVFKAVEAGCFLGMLCWAGEGCLAIPAAVVSPVLLWRGMEGGFVNRCCRIRLWASHVPWLAAAGILVACGETGCCWYWLAF
jgi:hypothetical protein